MDTFPLRRRLSLPHLGKATVRLWLRDPTGSSEVSRPDSPLLKTFSPKSLTNPPLPAPPYWSQLSSDNWYEVGCHFPCGRKILSRLEAEQSVGVFREVEKLM